MLSLQISKYSFNPQINLNSRKIAVVSSSKERLLGVSSPQKSQEGKKVRSQSRTPDYTAPESHMKFHPTINEYSKRLVESTNYENENEPRWNLLYEQHLKQKQKDDKRKLEHMQEKEEQIRQVCTFKPDIAPSKHYSTIGNVNNHHSAVGERMSAHHSEQLYVRNLAWQHQRQSSKSFALCYIHYFTLEM